MRINTTLISMATAGLFWLGGSPGLFSAEESTNAWRPAPAKLQVLEQKADDRDKLAQRCLILEKELTNLKTELERTSTQLGEYQAKDGSALLQDLERKAVGYAAMQSTLKKKDQTIAELQLQIEEQQKLAVVCQDEIDGLKAENGELRTRMAGFDKIQKSLQETLEQFWLGNYEYYQVAKGDTLEAIAGLPEYYNDPAKAVWIRQANVGHVQNMTNLTPGEVLIIPRFPPNGRYDF